MPAVIKIGLFAMCVATATAMIVLALDAPGRGCLAFGGAAGWLLFVAGDLL